MIKEQILIVEDDEINLKLFKELLKVRGYRVLEARNGKEALRILELEKPDLILMDILLPDTNGLEIIKLIKADLKTKGIPVIALTALAMQEDKVRCLQAGCVDYITKPINTTEFLDRIEESLKSD